ncbi:hypothetical protein EVAR_16187_1 [Eumeta japonica]|uniref:Uncharacterized protein n=1 Tax=Eumeta variegata TaxID=151549 RepID=A0A4C1WAV6_EUMVA|nr:hypothetical protein EVAR_16187_1 [Eumeta japonica]
MGDVLAAGSRAIDALWGLSSFAAWTQGTCVVASTVRTCHSVLGSISCYGRNRDSASTALRRLVPNRSPLPPYTKPAFIGRVYSAGDTSRTGWHSRGFAHVCGSGPAPRLFPNRDLRWCAHFASSAIQ